MVVDAVRAQLLGDGDAEALARVDLEHPAARAPGGASRPGEAVEAAPQVAGPLLVDRHAGRVGRGEPVGVAVDVRAGVVVAHAGVEVQRRRDRKPVDQERAAGERLEVRDDESPAVAPVVLPFGVEPALQLVPRGQVEPCAQLARERVLVEDTLPVVRRARHIAVRDGLRALLAVVELPGQVRVQRHALRVEMRVVVDRQVAHALPGQVDVAPRGIVVDARQAHLQPVRIGEEAALAPRLRDPEVVAETRSDVAQGEGGVAFAAGRVAQRPVFQRDAVGVVFDLVRGDLVVGVVRAGEVEPPVEMALAALQPR